MMKFMLILCLLTYVSAFVKLKQVPQIHRLRAIIEIKSDLEFEKFILKASDRPVVVDFQNSKCKPCIRAAPIYQALSEKYKDKVNFYKVDSDAWKDSLALMKANGVKSIPTFQIWVNGVKTESIQGVHLDEVEQKLVDNKLV